jgi:dTDP-glucose 4,6-dehydratase
MLDVLPPHFRFIHVSSDEVYGSLGVSDPPFSENTPLAPNSPYAASKAGSDGDGMNIRDWIHVDDHCAALWAVLGDGRLGTCYNIGGESETTNLEIVRDVVATLGKPESLITFVTDRPGHDRRYAMNIDRIRHDLGWRPTISLHKGLRSTIEWYLQNEDWWRPLLAESQRVADTIYRT